MLHAPARISSLCPLVLVRPRSSFPHSGRKNPPSSADGLPGVNYAFRPRERAWPSGGELGTPSLQFGSSDMPAPAGGPPTLAIEICFSPPPPFRSRFRQIPSTRLRRRTRSRACASRASSLFPLASIVALRPALACLPARPDGPVFQPCHRPDIPTRARASALLPFHPPRFGCLTKNNHARSSVARRAENDSASAGGGLCRLRSLFACVSRRSKTEKRIGKRRGEESPSKTVLLREKPRFDSSPAPDLLLPALSSISPRWSVSQTFDGSLASSPDAAD